MRTLALDVWQDLRTKRLWPVAAALAVAIVAVPLLLMRAPAQEPGAPPAAPSADAPGDLAGVAEPVELAGTSRLGRFDERDPFKHSKLPGLDFGTVTDSAPDASAAISGTSGSGDTAGASGGSGVATAGGGLPSASSPGGDTGIPGGSSGATPVGTPTGGTSSGGTPSGGGTSGGGTTPEPPETKYFTNEVDLRLRKPGGDVITPSGIRQIFTPIPSADPVVLYNGVVNRDSTKLAAFVVVDPAIVDRDAESCIYPSGPTTCLVFALEKGQAQRIDVGVEHYTLTVDDIRRVQVRGLE
jgi:hypothetical protein